MDSGGAVVEVARDKTDLEPNAGKDLDVTLPAGTYRRYVLRTRPLTADDDLVRFVGDRLREFFAGREHAVPAGHDWYLFVVEKVVAISQGRSYLLRDIRPGRCASLLCRLVSRSPYGIGLRSPWTMELAIREVGLPRILLAGLGGAVGKALGVRGVFYRLVGSDVRAIDGPTEYSVYPSNESAKLAPLDPDGVAAELSRAVRNRAPAGVLSGFRGTVVIDSNDLGRNVLGTDAPGSRKLFEDMFADNPVGQGREHTPLAVVVKR